MGPNFLVIGGTKCGTTSLYCALGVHADVFLAPKELRYFTAEHRLKKGPEWYAEQFAGAPPGAVCGEFSNAYTRDPVYRGVPARIKAALPGVRLVYLVREPFRRIASHYRHRLVTGAEWRSPGEAVLRDPSYVAASLYGRQLALYRDHFPPEQIFVLQSEDLFAEPGARLAEICRFIGVDPERQLSFGADNASAGRKAVPAALRGLARFPTLRSALRKTPGAMKTLGLGRFLGSAGHAPFALPEDLRDALRARFEEDRALLRQLAGNHVGRWAFGPDAPSTAPAPAGPPGA